MNFIVATFNFAVGALIMCGAVGAGLLVWIVAVYVVDGRVLISGPNVRKRLTKRRPIEAVLVPEAGDEPAEDLELVLGDGPAYPAPLPPLVKVSSTGTHTGMAAAITRAHALMKAGQR